MASKKKMRRQLKEMKERMAILEDAQSARELDEQLPSPPEPIFEINVFVIQDMTQRVFNLPTRQAQAAAATQAADTENADHEAADKYAREAEARRQPTAAAA